MPVTAQLQFTQNAVVGGAGQAYVGVPGAAVTVANANDAGVITWTYTLISVPTGSSYTPGIQQTGATPTFTFTPDVPGGFLFALSVTDGVFVSDDSRSFLGADTRGWLYFAHFDTDDTLNYGSPPNTQGWEPGINFILKDIHDNAFTGGGLPPAPAPLGSSVTYNLVVPPSPAAAFWDVVGGDLILSFSGISATEALGQSIASVSFSATANAVPLTATVSWSGVASGSQSVTPGTSMSGTITGPFVSSTNGASLSVTLTCVFPDGTKTASQAVTWSFGILYLTTGDTSANISAATAAYIESTYTNIQLHTSPTGSYVAAPTGTNNFPIAIPTAFGSVSWQSGGFPIIPSFIKTISNYVNPHGVTYSVDLYSFPNASNTYVLS